MTLNTSSNPSELFDRKLFAFPYSTQLMDEPKFSSPFNRRIYSNKSRENSHKSFQLNPQLTNVRVRLNEEFLKKYVSHYCSLKCA